ncbi:hypothetical protein ACKLNQ_12440 [Myroides odoratimimus]|uniref:hypothetical protein n=1 Tax=Myroides odoratimimus TaxID=76832 RepID=UPI0038D3E876
MNYINLTNHVFTNDRAELRRQIINIFLSEAPGTGKGENCSKYEYTMYNNDVHAVYLKRPAQFNNGFDFTIHISNINFNPKKRTNRPTHGNILDDLDQKNRENPALYLSLLGEITKIYNCQNYSLQGLTFQTGLPIDILLETIKWLFVEQDVTYWNYSGREMFFNAIQGI